MDLSELRKFENEHASVGKAFIEEMAPKYFGPFKIVPKEELAAGEVMFSTAQNPRTFTVGVDPAYADALELLAVLRKETAEIIDREIMRSVGGRPIGGIGPEAERKQLLELADLLEWEPREPDDKSRYVQCKRTLHAFTGKERVCDIPGPWVLNQRSADAVTAPALAAFTRDVHHVCAWGKLLMMRNVDVRGLNGSLDSWADFMLVVRRAFSNVSYETARAIVRMNDEGMPFTGIAAELRHRAWTI